VTLIGAIIPLQARRRALRDPNRCSYTLQARSRALRDPNRCSYTITGT